MTWLAWRQFRVSAAWAAFALVGLSAGLALTGVGLREEFTNLLAGCGDAGGAGGGGCGALAQQFFHDHQFEFFTTGAIVLAVPALIGMFWGAPLVARELEAGTHSVAWHQGVSRARWLAVKVVVVGLASVAFAALVSALVTAWAAPLDATAIVDFPRVGPLLFMARGSAPAGYAAVAFATGVVAGIILKRLVPAMALTLMMLVLLQVTAPVVRAHFMPPVKETVQIRDESSQFDLSRVGPDRVVIGPGESGAWVLSSRTVDLNGSTVESMAVSATGPCASPVQDRDACFAEMRDLGYQLEVKYHPAARFWPLQLIETGLCAILALAEVCVGLVLIRRPG